MDRWACKIQVFLGTGADKWGPVSSGRGLASKAAAICGQIRRASQHNPFRTQHLEYPVAGMIITARAWWIGVVILSLALFAHAAIPRYEWRQEHGSLIRIDRWTGKAELGRWLRVNNRLEWSSQREALPPAGLPQSPFTGR